MNAAKLILGLCFVAGLCIAAVLFLTVSQDSAGKAKQQAKAQGFLTTQQDFQDKLEELKRQRDRAKLQRSRLDERKQDAAQRLRNLGVKTPADIEANAEAKLAYHEIKDIIQSNDKLAADIAVYDDAIIRIEAALRELDRKRLMENAGISEDQFRQLRTIVNDVDDRLTSQSSSIDSLEVQSILDDVLGKSTDTQKQDDP